MQMKHRISILLLCALLVGMTTGFSVAAEQKAGEKLPYSYFLRCKQDWDETEKKVELELYAVPNGTQPLLEGGSFGLRFPKNMGRSLEFKPNEQHISTSKVVPPERIAEDSGDVIKKDGYLAFSWLKNGSVTGWPIVGDIPSMDRHLLIGTFSFTNVAAQPFKTDIGLMNFLNTAEAIPMELPEPERGDPAKDAFNITVWDVASSKYVGYFPGSDVTIQRSAIEFLWEPPSVWKNAFTILSYDPKKPVTVELCDEDGITIAEAITAPQWQSGVTTGDNAMLYAATEGNKNRGIGPYFAAVDLETFKSGDAFVKAEVGKKYILRIEKACHLTVELKLTATSTSFVECTGFPEESAPVYLTCGDINPVADVGNEGKYIYGDGAITLFDRSLLTAFLDMKIIAKSPILEEVDGLKNPAYYADLDGDGAITLVDLSILTAELNFAKRSQ